MSCLSSSRSKRSCTNHLSDSATATLVAPVPEAANSLLSWFENRIEAKQDCW